MSRMGSARQARGWRLGFNLFQNRRTTWQMIREWLGGRYRMSFITTAVFIFSIIYVLFPFDLIWDTIPFLGWIDDGLVVYLLMKRLHAESQRFVRFKANERRRS